MKVTIKTLDEARVSRVEMTFQSEPTHEHVIEFSRSNAEVSLEPAERLYTAAEVGDAQTGEAELVTAPLKRRIDELDRLLCGQVDRAEILEGELEVQRDRANRYQKWAERADRKAEIFKKQAREDTDLAVQLNNCVVQLENQVKGLDHNRNAEQNRANQERQRADQNREWAERAEVRAEKAEKLSAEMKELAERAEERARSCGSSLTGLRGELDNACRVIEYRNQTIKLARQALCDYFPVDKVNGDIAPLITEIIYKIEELRGEVGGYQESSERCERELHDSRVSVESRDRLLTTATTALRNISLEVSDGYGTAVADPVVVVGNVRDLASPWADTSSKDKAGRPLYQA